MGLICLGPEKLRNDCVCTQMLSYFIAAANQGKFLDSFTASTGVHRNRTCDPSLFHLWWC